MRQREKRFKVGRQSERASSIRIIYLIGYFIFSDEMTCCSLLGIQGLRRKVERARRLSSVAVCQRIALRPIAADLASS